MADVLERSFSGPNGQTITARVRVPVQDPEIPEVWRCSYQVLGLGHQKWRMAVGVDAVQALLLALSNISSTLYASEAYRSGQLEWLEGMNGDLGLPRAAVLEDWLREEEG
jgi:hypothetical protein